MQLRITIAEYRNFKNLSGASKLEKNLCFQMYKTYTFKNIAAHHSRMIRAKIAIFRSLICYVVSPKNILEL